MNLNLLNTFKEQSPYYNIAISIVSLVILIFPILLSTDMMIRLIYLLNLRLKYLHCIIFIWLASTTYTLGHFIHSGVKTHQKNKEEKIKKEKKEQKLNNLTLLEKKILRYYFENNTKTQKLWVSNGEVWGLKKAGIIWLAEPHPEEIVTGFCSFNIDDYCWNYLNKNSDLLG